MPRIYPVVLEVIVGLRPFAEQIERRDPDLARQLRRALASIPLNVMEGGASQGRNRRARYFNAFGSAQEVEAIVDTAQALGYVGALDAGVRRQLTHVACTLRKLTVGAAA
jgi:four helix bundle protein